MKTTLKVVAFGVMAYLVVWGIIFTAITGGDFAYLENYFVWGWTGGGEIPTIIQGLAVLTSLIATIIFAVWIRFRKRPKKP